MNGTVGGVDGDAVVGIALVAGFVVFLTGAVRWRLEYEKGDAWALVHADRARRLWIHLWMLPGVFVTTAGVAGFAAWSGSVLAVMAATVFALGATGMVVHLVFRLAVVPWMAERYVADGAVPGGFEVLEAWTGWLYVVHMAASYTAFALLGLAVLDSDVLPSWTGWLGLGLGVLCLAGFVATRFAGPFNPPILAHTYTAVLGTTLLLT
jgi:hypothetical protein